MMLMHFLCLQINRPDLKHRLLEGSLSEIKRFLVKRRFKSIVKLIIAKGKFEKRKLSASNVSVREALHVTFQDLYELTNVIGEGSFGTVYEGYLKRNATAIAVKIIDRTNLKPDDEKANRIECEILQQLAHPHIITCIDFFEEPATFFIVMELVNGGELFDRIAKKVTYSEGEARNVLLILLSAIKHCHDHDIVHRFVTRCYFIYIYISLSANLPYEVRYEVLFSTSFALLIPCFRVET
jgi:serine/threonine protein kinase